MNEQSRPVLETLLGVAMIVLLLWATDREPAPKPGESVPQPTPWREKLADAAALLMSGSLFLFFWGGLILGGLFVLVKLIKWMWNA